MTGVAADVHAASPAGTNVEPVVSAGTLPRVMTPQAISGGMSG